MVSKDIENQNAKPLTEEEKVERNVPYGVWRKDKPASAGYSHELVCNTLDKAHYDTIEQLPLTIKGADTIIGIFDNQATKTPDREFLGTR